MNRFLSFSKSRENWIGTGIFLFTVLWFGIFALLRIDLHHDAVMLKPAIDVAAGKVIFRDTFCQYGALAIWIQALAVKLFGGDLAVIQLLTVLFYGGCAVVSDKIFRRFLTFPFRAINLVMFWGLAPFYFVPMHPWSSVYALFFMLLNAEFMLRFLDDGAERSLWLSGGFAGLAFLARHPCGVVYFSGLAVLIVMAFCERGKLRKAAVYSAGFAAVLAVFALYLTLVGAWSDYLRQCFGYVIGFAVERGGNLQWGEIAKRFFPLDEVMWLIDTVYSVLPLLCLGWVWAAVRHIRDVSDAERIARLKYLLLGLTGLVSWHQYYPVPCLRHLYWAAIPMFGVLALTLQKLWCAGNLRMLKRFAALLLAVIALMPVGVRLCCGAFPLLKSLPAFHRVTHLPGLRNMLLSQKELNAIEPIWRIYNVLPPEIKSRGVFNYSPDAVFSVMLPETGFRHQMFVNWGGGVYPDYPEKALAYIQSARPAVLSQQPVILPDYRLVLQTELYGLQYWFYLPLH